MTTRAHMQEQLAQANAQIEQLEEEKAAIDSTVSEQNRKLAEMERKLADLLAAHDAATSAQYSLSLQQSQGLQQQLPSAQKLSDVHTLLPKLVQDKAPCLTGTTPEHVEKWSLEFTLYLTKQDLEFLIQESYTASKQSVAKKFPGYKTEELHPLLHKRVYTVIVEAIQDKTGPSIDREFAALAKAGTLSAAGEPYQHNVKAIWDKIKATYGKRTMLNAIGVFQRLTRVRLQRGENPVVYLNKVNELCNQLELAKYTLPTEWRTLFYLQGIKESYPVVYENLATKENPLINDIHSTLVKLHDDYVNSRQSSAKQQSKGNTERANLAASHGNRQLVHSKRNNSRNSDWSFCHHCNKHVNHTADRCHRNPANRSSAKSSTSSQQHQFMLREEQLEEFHSLIDGLDLSDEVYHTLATRFAQSGPNWHSTHRTFILDSGAGSHSTGDRGLLQNVESMRPINVTCALGRTVKVKEFGQMRLSSNVRLNDVKYLPGSDVNLVSVARICDSGNKGGLGVLFLRDKAMVLHELDVRSIANLKLAPIISFQRDGNLYQIERKQESHDDAEHPPLQLVEAPKSEARIPKKVPLASATKHRGTAPVIDRNKKYPSSDHSQTASSSVPAVYLYEHANVLRYSSTVPSPLPAMYVHDTASSGSSSAMRACNAASSNLSATYVSGHTTPGNQQTLSEVTQTLSKVTQPYTRLPYADTVYHIAESEPAHDAEPSVTAATWHARLGHQQPSALKALNKQFDLGITSAELTHTANCACEACILAKSKHSKVRHSNSHTKLYRATHPTDAIHLDSWGPITRSVGKGKHNLPSLGGNLYGLTAVVEYSRFTVMALVKSKDELTIKAIHVLKQLQTALRGTFKRVHCDNGSEFINTLFKSYLHGNGTLLITTSPGTPAQNSIAERANGVHHDVARAMLVHSKAPAVLWGDATLYATLIHNCTPLAANNGATPYHVSFGYTPNIRHLRVFGCDVYLLIEKAKRGKFEAKARRMVFIGTSPNHIQGYRLMCPITQEIVVSRNVKFVENSFEAMRALSANLETNGVNTNSDISAADVTDLFEQVNNSPATEAGELLVPSTNLFEHHELISQREVSTDPLVAEVNDFEIDGIELDTGASDQSAGDDGDTADMNVLPDVGATAGDSVEPPPPRPPPPFNENVEDSLLRKIAELEAKPLVSQRGRALKPRLIPGMVNDHLVSPDQGIGLYLVSLKGPVNEHEPNTFAEAMRTLHKREWFLAMADEIKSIIELGVYTVVPLPPGKTAIRGRWVLKRKLDHNNIPIRFKARFTPQGFRQESGMDYIDTYAPVVRFKSVKVLLAYAAIKDLELVQYDVKTAFLNAPLDADLELYVQPPDGFPEPDGNVWKLNKSLYGLKQAPHDWNRTIDALIKEIGFTQTTSDSCFYHKATTSGRRIFMLLYVDDTVVAYDKRDEAAWLACKKRITNRFKIDDIGELHWVLNMRIQRDRVNRTITLSQQAYIERKLKELKMDECKTATTPCIDGNLELPLDSTDAVPLTSEEHAQYRVIIGVLLYAANCTRADIIFIVSRLSRYVASPCQHHLVAAKRVLRYLAGTATLALVFKPTRNPLYVEHDATLCAYSDSDWAGSKFDGKSTTGLAIAVFGNALFWLSKKQSIIAQSSTEAEYVAVNTACNELLWFQKLLLEAFDIVTGNNTIFCDNRAAVQLCNDADVNARNKHIRLRYHQIKLQVREQAVRLKWLQTSEQLADMFTKCLNTGKFLAARKQFLQPSLDAQ